MADFTESFKNKNYNKKTNKSGNINIPNINEVQPKQQQKKLYVIASMIGVLCVIGSGFFFLYFVSVPNFVGASLDEVQLWAVSNEVQLNIEQEYSKDADELQLISQSILPGSRVSKKTILNVVVSKGANPDEKILLPDFHNMSATKIKDWIATNKAVNMKVALVFDEEINKDMFIKIEYTNPAVTASNYIRKNSATIYVSKGKEIHEKNIVVPDFIGKNKNEAEFWANGKEITIVFKESYSNSVDRQTIISQDIPAKDKIAKKDSITIEISKGPYTVVPWFGNMTKTEARQVPKLQVMITEKYDMTARYGSCISQSIAAGEIIGASDMEPVIVTYSLGRPYIKNFIGYSQKDIEQYFSELIDKGTSITYEFQYETDNSVPRGNVIRSSISGDYIEMDAHVIIYIAR